MVSRPISGEASTGFDEGDKTALGFIKAFITRLIGLPCRINRLRLDHSE
jgi:hypothetical protein